jgi:Icc-related predicted phosphoesterase
MRLLHCTDFHANLDWFRWLAQVAPNYDLVCLSGDLLDQGSPKTISRQKAEITAIISAIVTPMAICSGNHDVEPMEEEDSRRGWVSDLQRMDVWVDGDRFNLGWQAFYCHPWNEPIPPAASGDIWVIHAPPEGCLAAVGESGQRTGDFELGELCRRGLGPRLALCGHVHTPRSWSSKVGATRIFNPGYNAAAVWPSHIVFDLEGGSAIRRDPGLTDEAITFTPKIKMTRDRPGEMPVDRLERLLELAVLNQRIEGFDLTPKEVDECRHRLRGVARLKSSIRTSHA